MGNKITRSKKAKKAVEAQCAGGSSLPTTEYAPPKAKTPVESNQWKVKRGKDIKPRAAPLKICVIGSGNFGSTVAKVLAENASEKELFDSKVVMWTFDEKIPDRNNQSIVDIINTEHENVKYLPGIALPHNLYSERDLNKAVKGSDLLVFVCPHQFLPRTCKQIKPDVKEGAYAITLIKGMFAQGGDAKLVSTFINEELNIPCSALSGANVAKDLASKQFCGATVGSASLDEAEIWVHAFSRPYYTIRAVRDVSGVQACGALKNVIALGAGIVDGMGFGTNTKSEFLRQGMAEIVLFADTFFTECNPSTFLENCGMADLITTCFGGRNRRCGEAFVKDQAEYATLSEKWKEIEKVQLNGQKIAGLPTTKEAHEIIVNTNKAAEFPLFVKIYEICYEGHEPNTIFRNLTKLSKAKL